MRYAEHQKLNFNLPSPVRVTPKAGKGLVHNILWWMVSMRYAEHQKLNFDLPSPVRVTLKAGKGRFSIDSDSKYRLGSVKVL
jgi:hypothetical protein